MRKLLLITFVLSTMVAWAQTVDNNPKDLWVTSIEVTLGDDWRQKPISIPEKKEPNVVDFFRAFAKAYPCEYHDLLTLAIDGDEEVLFNHKKPKINIDKDSCFLQNGSFSMRVFYENDKPVALGICCHKALLTEQQDAYYYSYTHATRKLTPMAQGSDFTEGIVKRETNFYPGRDNNRAIMIRRWRRCGIENEVRFIDGKLVFEDRTKTDFARFTDEKDITMSILDAFLWIHKMEPRMPEIADDESKVTIEGGDYAIPTCLAYIDQHSKDNYAAAKSFEGHFYFYARGWEKPDGRTLVAVYSECAPKFDYDFQQKNEDGSTYKTPHQLKADDEVSLQFYLCDGSEMVTYLNPSSPKFKKVVGQGMPNLEHNEWRCVITHENEELVFVRESDGLTKTFIWDGNLLKEQ